MKKYLIVEHDPLFICQRLKEIDESYFVLYNLQSCQFEVHSNSQEGNSFCFAVRFDGLDARTLEKARETRKENIDALIAKMDEENDRLYKKQIEDAAWAMAEVIK